MAGVIEVRPRRRAGSTDVAPGVERERGAERGRGPSADGPRGARGRGGAGGRGRARGRGGALPLQAGAVVLALGFLVWRVSQLDHESLWLDEGYTLLFSRMPFPQLLLVGGAHEHPPFYYALVHLLLALHDSYLAPRLIAAVSGALSVVTLYALGARLFSRPAGLIAATLMAVSPLHFWYSQDGRSYELAGLLVLLSYLCVFTALDRPRRSWWVAYALVTALALYTEYTTIFALLPQALLWLQARRLGRAAPLLRSWAAAALLFAPWLSVLLPDARGIAGGYWIPPPTPATVANTVLEFLGWLGPCPSPPCSGASLALLTGERTLVAGTVILVVAVVAVWAARQSLRLAVVGLWLLLPFVLVLLLSLARSLYLDRVFLDATFAFYLLAAGALAALARRVSALPTAVLLSAWITTNLLTVSAVYSHPSNPDWKSPARDFSAAYRPGQAVVFYPGVVRQLVTAYLPAGWHATRERSVWLHSYLDVPGWTLQTITDPSLRGRQLAQAARGLRQVWLITLGYTGLMDTRHWFMAHGFHPLLSQVYQGETRIELWDRGEPRDFGPPAAADNGFAASWTETGNVSRAGGVATTSGHAGLRRTFSLQAGAAYTVNVEYRCPGPAQPAISLRAETSTRQTPGSYRNRYGWLLNSFPRTQWYEMPITGVWLSQPLGFVAPPGTVRGVLQLGTSWGACSWRHIAVYRER